MIHAIALTLLAQSSEALLPGERPAYAIRDYVQPADCDGKTCDLSPAFARIFAAADAAPAPVGMRAPGSLITIPPGEWRLSKPIVLLRPHTIRGAGGSLWGAATVLRVMTSTHGAVVRQSASGAVLADFALITAMAATNADRHGIVLNGRADIERMWLRGFVHGVHVFGWAQRGSNVNGARLRGLRIDLCEHAGVFVDGPDANASLFDSLDLGSNCQLGTRWSASLGRPCANAIDSSFLGNTWINVETAGARDRVTKEIFRGFDFDSSAQRSVCLGCYSESDQLPSAVSQSSDVLGGIGAWTGPGFRLEGRAVNGLRARGVPAKGDLYPPEVWLGDSGPTGTALSLMPPQSGSSVLPNAVVRWRLDTTAGKRSWRIDVAGADAAVAQRISLEPGRYGVTAIKTSTRTTP